MPYRIINISDVEEIDNQLPRLIVVDNNNEIVNHLVEYYLWLAKYFCSEGVAKNYLRHVIKFRNFLEDRGFDFLGSENHVRRSIEVYFVQIYRCSYYSRHSKLIINRSNTVSAGYLKIILIGLRRYYDYLLVKKMYRYSNPMLDASVQSDVDPNEFTMPPESGMVVKKIEKISKSYYYVKTDDWRPRTIVDYELPQKLISHTTNLRDKAIISTLFETGSRVGETLGIDLGDLLSDGSNFGAMVTNKGSCGIKNKEVWWSFEHNNLLNKYMRTERQEIANHNSLDLDLPSSPLFINRFGKRISYHGFYYRWQRICEDAGVNLSIHQIRHWFITFALLRIEDIKDPSQYEFYRNALVEYIKWTDEKTIIAYDQRIKLFGFNKIQGSIFSLLNNPQKDEIPVPEISPEIVIPDETVNFIKSIIDGE